MAAASRTLRPTRWRGAFSSVASLWRSIRSSRQHRFPSSERSLHHAQPRAAFPRSAKTDSTSGVSIGDPRERLRRPTPAPTARSRSAGLRHLHDRTDPSSFPPAVITPWRGCRRLRQKWLPRHRPRQRLGGPALLRAAERVTWASLRSHEGLVAEPVVHVEGVAIELDRLAGGLAGPGDRPAAALFPAAKTLTTCGVPFAQG
jgi:hypothetical protein